MARDAETAPPAPAAPSTIGDPSLRSAFGFDRDDDGWLSVAGRADGEPELGRVGAYELLGEAGHGAQGRVYKAVQPGTGRHVALKRLGAGRFATTGMRLRFEREVRALASLSHPGIVTVFGADEVDGQRILLMEWIDGAPIDAWARARPLRERLGALALVCDAVQHAHQRGVIHRDLKPSNILVAGDGRPRVLDFGLAKLLEDEAAETGGSRAGRTRSFVGTPAYAAPEQVRGGPDAVDTRTDVYALGAILYELLTGVPPIDRSADLPAMFDAIVSADPRRPSSIDRALGTELDAIALKALAKEPDRRYQSVEALGADLRRYLAGQAVLAHPPSRAYHARKFAARHRAAVAAAALALVGLAAFGVYASTQSRRFARLAREEHGARVAAEQAQAATAVAERDAVAGRERADRESARAASVTEFLLETLALADPDVTQVPDMSVRDMLDHAAGEAAIAFSEQPEAEAQVRAVMGRAYAALGALHEAEAQLARALRIHDQGWPEGWAVAPRRDGEHGPDPGGLYGILWPYAHVLEELTDVATGKTWARLEPLPAAIIGESHPRLAEALRAMSKGLGGDAPRPLLDAALRAAGETLGPDDPDWLYVGDALYLAGRALARRSRNAEACEYLRAALDLQRERLGPTHSRVLQTLDALTSAQIRDRRYADAEALISQAIGLLEEALPADHWSVAVFEGRLGYCLLGQGRHEEAVTLMRGSLDRVLAGYGWTHRSVRETLSQLARAYDAIGRADDARRARRDLAGALARLPVPGSGRFAAEAYAQDHDAFGRAFVALREELWAGSDRVPALLDALIADRRALFADADEFAALFVDQMIPALNAYINKAGFNQHSLRAYREVLRISRANEVLHTSKRAGAAFWVSWNLEAFAEHAEGEALARESIEIGLARPAGRAYGGGGLSASLVGVHVLAQGRYDEAERWLAEGVELLRDSEGVADANTLNVWGRLVGLYAAWGRSERLVPHLRRVIDSRPPPHVLDAWAWNVLVLPGLGAPAYEAAFEAIRRADELQPGDVQIVKTLGMGLYRLGRFEESLDHMRRADVLRRATFPAGIPEDVAFIALSLHALGRTDEANAARARMNALIEDDRPDHPAALTIQREVDRTFKAGGRP